SRQPVVCLGLDRRPALRRPDPRAHGAAPHRGHLMSERAADPVITEPALIELREVTKAYRTHTGDHIVLDRLSLAFAPRENVGILGRNGAGKSTLLRIIGGAEHPDAG